MKRSKPLRRAAIKRAATAKPRKATKKGSGSLTRRKGVQKVNRKRKASEFARTYHSKLRVQWIKARKCVVSGLFGNIENVHVRGGGAGRKAGYEWIVPMSAELHRELHLLGIRTFQSKWQVDLSMKALFTMAEWNDYAYINNIPNSAIEP